MAKKANCLANPAAPRGTASATLASSSPPLAPAPHAGGLVSRVARATAQTHLLFAISKTFALGHFVNHVAFPDRLAVLQPTHLILDVTKKKMILQWNVDVKSKNASDVCIDQIKEYLGN